MTTTIKAQDAFGADFFFFVFINNNYYLQSYALYYHNSTSLGNDIRERQDRGSGWQEGEGWQVTRDATRFESGTFFSSFLLYLRLPPDYHRNSKKPKLRFIPRLGLPQVPRHPDSHLHHQDEEERPKRWFIPLFGLITSARNASWARPEVRIS